MNQKRVAIVLGVAVATAVSAVLGFSVAFSYAVLDAEVPDPDEFDVKEE